MPDLLAHVVPLAPVEGVFTYVVPDALAEAVAVGARVVVPFGRREITGGVVQLASGDARRRIVDSCSVCDRPWT